MPWRPAAMACRLTLLLGALCLATAFTPPRAGSAADPAPLLDFALMGDTPYSGLEELALDRMMKDIDRAPLAFVVHVGDFKNGATPCSDELFLRRFRLFNTSAHPFVFLFGDNEWTDCHRASAGGHDPVERLQKLREIFTAGDTSLGRRTMPLQRQSEVPRWAKFRENVRWIHGGAVFVGLDVPGGNNNLGRTRAGNAEWAERNAANIAWVRASFADAGRRGAPGVLLALQANPYFEQPRGSRGRSGFETFLAVVEQEAVAFGRPVVFVHGDTHWFRIDRPLTTAAGRAVESFTRVEVPGSPVVAWVRGRVDPLDPHVFSFRAAFTDRPPEDRGRP